MDVETSEPEVTAKFVARVSHYVDARGQNITEFAVLRGELPSDHPKFVGRATAQIGGREFPLEFPIEADTLDRAFVLFQSVAEAAGQEAVSRVRREATKPRLLGPTGESL